MIGEQKKKLFIAASMILATVIIYLLWSRMSLVRLESPGETNELPGLQGMNLEGGEAEVFSPLRGLTDSIKNIKEVLLSEPDNTDKSFYWNQTRGFLQKAWKKIYEILP